MLPGISAFVLQSGIFSEKTNAEQAKNELKSSGFPALVSEKDGQYFLLAGIAASDKEAKKIAGQMKKSKLDVYAKEWPIAEKEIHMEKKEYEWIVGIQKKLQSTLTSMSENGNINSSVWEGTDEKQPANSNKLKGIRADVSAMAKLGTEATEENKQQLLLQIFQDYESISGD
ncbi:SPOR domain-containing protein [Virgibacillus halophilus]|uniref:SPOR domain-containing protein n=2 Tax=Tigheibacillus halophilus TaxID=361280 RepID=A0ABU5CE75_9BACI|nr:SPOR domain-containing protein [Virgibacillus halophilus]